MSNDVRVTPLNVTRLGASSVGFLVDVLLLLLKPFRTLAPMDEKIKIASSPYFLNNYIEILSSILGKIVKVRTASNFDRLDQGELLTLTPEQRCLSWLRQSCHSISL
jgi:hypothetical protein